MPDRAPVQTPPKAKSPIERAVELIEPGLVALLDEVPSIDGWRDEPLPSQMYEILTAVKRYGDARERKAK